MMNNGFIKTILIVFLIIALFFVINKFQPYNNAELNLATIYYQTYRFVLCDIEQLITGLDELSKENNSSNVTKIKLTIQSLKQNITIFSIANQTHYRDTIFFNKVFKPSINNNDLEMFYTSLSALEKYLSSGNYDTNKIKMIGLYLADIRQNLEPKSLGYEKGKFRVELDKDSEIRAKECIKILDEYVCSLLYHRPQGE